MSVEYGEKKVCVLVCCWRCREAERPEVADVFGAICDVSSVSRWVGSRLFVGTAGAVGGDRSFWEKKVSMFTGFCR